MQPIIEALATEMGSAKVTRMNKPVRVVGSQDPNDKTGSAGFGPAHYVDAAAPLQFNVMFENVMSATAPPRRW